MKSGMTRESPRTIRNELLDYCVIQTGEVVAEEVGGGAVVVTHPNAGVDVVHAERLFVGFCLEGIGAEDGFAVAGENNDAVSLGVDYPEPVGERVVAEVGNLGDHLMHLAKALAGDSLQVFALDAVVEVTGVEVGAGLCTAVDNAVFVKGYAFDSGVSETLGILDGEERLRLVGEIRGVDNAHAVCFHADEKVTGVGIDGDAFSVAADGMTLEDVALEVELGEFAAVANGPEEVTVGT